MASSSRRPPLRLASSTRPRPLTKIELEGLSPRAMRALYMIARELRSPFRLVKSERSQ